ncbi:MAG TPA: hypothetical protein VGA75_03520 [Paracoccaceae bacterium]
MMRRALRANAGLLFAGMASFVLMGAGQALYGPALPAFARAFGLQGQAPGLLISAHWVGAALGVGVMFLRGGSVTPRLTLAAMAAGAALVAAGLIWALVLLGAVLFGLGYGASTVIYNRRFLASFGARGPAMLGLVNAVFGIGAIGAPLVFVWLGSQPQLAFGLVAGLAVLTLAGAGGAGREQVAALLPGRFVVQPGILAFGAVAIGMEACLIGLGPTALIAAGETETRAAELLSAFFVAFLLMRVGLVWLSTRLRPFTLLMLALAGAGVSALGAATISAAWFFVPLGACAGLFFPAFYVCAAARMGDDPRVSPTIIASGLAGGIVSPLVLGGVVALLGNGVFFWIVAGVTLAAAATGSLMPGRMNRVPA